MAYRILGSLSEADDAVQDAWLRLSRADTSGVENLGGWLTTVVARVSLNMLRSRRSRREEPMGPHMPQPIIDRADAGLLMLPVGLGELPRILPPAPRSIAPRGGEQPRSRRREPLDMGAGQHSGLHRLHQWLCSGNAHAAEARVNAGDCWSIVPGNIRITPSISLITPAPPEPKGLDGTEVRGSGKS